MGADYYAYALIGCEVDPKLLWESHPIRQCRHDIPEGFRFCPECGKPNQPIITYRRRFGEDREDYDSTEKDLLRDGFGYEAQELDGLIIKPTTDGRGAVAGILSCMAHDNHLGFSPIDIDDLDHITSLIAKAEDILSEHGLWDKDKFGLYAVQNCSY